MLAEQITWLGHLELFLTYATEYKFLINIIFYYIMSSDVVFTADIDNRPSG
jgi:hypothetical protein